jgi:hypothetical protein
LDEPSVFMTLSNAPAEKVVKAISEFDTLISGKELTISQDHSPLVKDYFSLYFSSPSPEGKVDQSLSGDNSDSTTSKASRSF